jgi:integrase
VEVWRGCDDAGEFGSIVRLLILTGQRRSEIGDLAWPEVDLAKRQIDLPEHRTKNKRAHIVPLSDEAIEILEALPWGERTLIFGRGAGGFGAFGQCKEKLDERIAKARKGKPMQPWVLHDARRSFVTHVSERGFAQPHVVEAIVNHVSGHKAGVAGVYNKAAYLNEKRQALELWAAHVLALVNGTASNVIPLTRGQKASA